ncbi:hypothetical protein EB118_24140 [bacterium]|nr:hypothetical protein [bacterium]NDG33145.1 hypothetical protein [bacterium]
MQIDKVNENLFWDLVEKLDYKNKYHSKYKHNWEELRNAINEFYEIASQFADALSDRTKAKDIDLYGTDTGNDATSLAVGLGKETYYELLNNQDAFDEFIDNYSSDFHENFKYCFLLD